MTLNAVEVEFFNASEIKQSLKATVHSTGRMGFSRTAERTLNLAAVASILIGRTAGYDQDKSLVLKIAEAGNPNGFEVMRSGVYYYANTRNLFDLLDEDYKRLKIVYDIIPQGRVGEKTFKLKRRVIERKT